MAMGGAHANLRIDSEIGVDAESRCRNSMWTKKSASVGMFTLQPLCTIYAKLIATMLSKP